MLPRVCGGTCREFTQNQSSWRRCPKRVPGHNSHDSHDHLWIVLDFGFWDSKLVLKSIDSTDVVL